MRPRRHRIAWLTLVPLLACGGDQKGAASMSLSISSPAFQAQTSIPARHTCEGADVSPALEWAGVPPGSKTLALIVDDPDAPDPAAPRTTWVHWVVYDIPAHTTGLPENAGRAGAPAAGREGLNDWKRPGWGGPCPPIGRHRYFFKLFALDTALTSLERPTRSRLEEAMNGHVLARGELIGLYQKAGH